MTNKDRLKKRLENILCVDSIDGLLWNYEPRNYKVGDEIVCIESMQNGNREEIIAGNKYIVAWYDKGNPYRKGYLQVEGGRGVFWDDDQFELVTQNKIEDIECIDVTNQVSIV